MKIFICCSKHFYHLLPPVISELEGYGHVITPPNSYEEPFKEEEMRQISPEAHNTWKADMIRLQEPKVRANDAILVMNMEKRGQPNYIGGATFLEIYKAFELGKGIFLYNPIPENLFKDELEGMSPIIINAKLSVFKNPTLEDILESAKTI